MSDINCAKTVFSDSLAAVQADCLNRAFSGPTTVVCCNGVVSGSDLPEHICDIYYVTPSNVDAGLNGVLTLTEPNCEVFDLGIGDSKGKTFNFTTVPNQILTVPLYVNSVTDFVSSSECEYVITPTINGTDYGAVHCALTVMTGSCGLNIVTLQKAYLVCYGGAASTALARLWVCSEIAQTVTAAAVVHQDTGTNCINPAATAVFDTGGSTWAAKAGDCIGLNVVVSYASCASDVTGTITAVFTTDSGCVTSVKVPIACTSWWMGWTSWIGTLYPYYFYDGITSTPVCVGIPSDPCPIPPGYKAPCYPTWWGSGIIYYLELLDTAPTPYGTTFQLTVSGFNSGVAGCAWDENIPSGPDPWTGTVHPTGLSAAFSCTVPLPSDPPAYCGGIYTHTICAGSSKVVTAKIVATYPDGETETQTAILLVGAPYWCCPAP